MSRRRAAPPPPIEEVARIAERLAVLLSAGVSPVSAWDYLLPPGPIGRSAAADPSAAGHADPYDPSVAGRAEPPGPPAARGTRRVKARADAERAQHSIL
ncbi:hypothetical protein E3O57_17540, partial [Cryobacterium sp. TMN-39-2]